MMLYVKLFRLSYSLLKQIKQGNNKALFHTFSYENARREREINRTN